MCLSVYTKVGDTIEWIDGVSVGVWPTEDGDVATGQSGAVVVAVVTMPSFLVSLFVNPLLLIGVTFSIMKYFILKGYKNYPSRFGSSAIGLNSIRSGN